jgi:hypothetical protein
MKKNQIRNKCILLLFLVLACLKNYSQELKLTVQLDPKLEQLLAEKRKINNSLMLNESYKIQIYTGNNETAKKTLNEFRTEYKEIDATIVFNTPNYKVWVGNFKTRIEAEKVIADLKYSYKNILLIKPSKQ